MICPYQDHPLSELSKFLSKLISPIIRESEYTLKDSVQFVQDIKSLKLSRNDIMFSLDIVNLFTNIPIDFTMKIIEAKLNSDTSFQQKTNLPVIEVIKLIEFCMKSTSFAFNGKFYYQKSGAPMGCNLSPIVAEALVSYIFDQAMKTFDIKPKFIRFYVDDSFLIMNSRFVDSFLNAINDLGKTLGSIKFTIEKEVNCELPFLDVQVTRSNGTLSTRVYRKPTHSNRYLNFNSHHSIQNKKSVIRTLINRAFTHSSEQQGLNSEIQHIKSVLLENNYPSSLIDQVIQECKNKHNPNQIKISNFDISKVISIPYYRFLGENIKNTLRKFDIQCVFNRGLTLRNILNNSINKNNSDKSHVVYSVDCIDCPAVYVGTTKRKLSKRINEHRNALSSPNIISNIAEHSFQTKHSINFQNQRVIYKERRPGARRFLECFQIEKFKYEKRTLMNDHQNSITNIPPIYLSLLNIGIYYR